MIHFFRHLRLVPIALIASACLLTLTLARLALDGGYVTTADPAPAVKTRAAVTYFAPKIAQTPARRSWAQEMFNFPDSRGSQPAPTSVASLPAIPPLDRGKLGGGDITGSITPADDKQAAKVKGQAAGEHAKSTVPQNGTVISLAHSLPSDAKRVILERLQERRQELDTRSRELDIREGLVAAAEKRVEAQLTELKEVKAQITVASKQSEQAQASRFKGLVTMYENMKPRDAAKIFDRLEIGVLIEVASQINPRRMADILAQMSPDAAERLTVELASRDRAIVKNGADLPKIDGQPSMP